MIDIIDYPAHYANGENTTEPPNVEAWRISGYDVHALYETARNIKECGAKKILDGANGGDCGEEKLKC